MIKVKRGAEPLLLEAIRVSELSVLRKIAPKINSKQIPDGYKKVGLQLCQSQYYKCCYCETNIQKSNHDVEHYRPKASACRSPGCSEVHGYWWLAYTWSNLLYSCSNCNRIAKNDKFPLESGSTSLREEEIPPALEVPLLIDPGGNINPVEHIEFVYTNLLPTAPKYWYATPRGGSIQGMYSIDVCSLNRQDLLETRHIYYENYILPQIKALKHEISLSRGEDLSRQFDRAIAMLFPTNQFVAFTYDAFRAAVSSDEIFLIIGKRWPEPEKICNF